MDGSSIVTRAFDSFDTHVAIGVRGETEGIVEFTGINTSFGRAAAPLANPEELIYVQYLLVTIVGHWAPLSLVMSMIVLLYVRTAIPFMEATSFVVVPMVASVPMAMEIGTATTLALDSKELTNHGAIERSNSNYPDMSILLFFNFANAFIDFCNTTDAADAVEALNRCLNTMATVKRNGR